jgi:hypothetical protein
MRARRIACLLLGLWMGAGLLMAWVALENSRSVDRVLARGDPAVLLQFKTMDRTQATLLLRHVASEQGSYLRETWETTQLFLAAFLFFFLLFGTDQGKFSLALGLALFLIVASQRLGLTPEIVARIRALDFGAVVSRRDQLQLHVLEYAYNLSELVKGVVGLVLAGMLIWPRGGRSLDAGEKFHVVDKADHRHINR